MNAKINSKTKKFLKHLKNEATRIRMSKEKMFNYDQLIFNDDMTLWDVINNKPAALGAPYKPEQLQFITCAPLKAEKVRVVSVDNCREIAIQNMAGYIVKNSPCGIAIMDTRTDESDSKFENTLFVINSYELALGWKPTTIVSIKSGHKGLITLGINANPKWFVAPHTISLLMLFLRSGYLFTKAGFKCPECIQKVIKKYGSTGDLQYIKKHHDKIFNFLRNLHLIYGEFTSEELYTDKLLKKKSSEYAVPSYAPRKEGIDYILGGTSRNEKLLKRYKEVCG